MKPITKIPYMPLRGCEFGKLPVGNVLGLPTPFHSAWFNIRQTLKIGIQVTDILQQ